jgi:hypothetical protein
MSERPEEDTRTPAHAESGPMAKLRGTKPMDLVRGLLRAGVVVVTVIVALDLVGVLDVFDDQQIEPASGSRLPGEYLYLDDERVDAYLGQLRGGLSPTEQRSISLTENRATEVGLEQVVQIGGNVERKEVIERTVSSQAADRFFVLESELEARYSHTDAVGLRFKRIEASRSGCREIVRLETIKEGQIVRITGVNLRVPTYALALAKVAHADQFLVAGQAALPKERLVRLATERQPALKRLVESLGPDPRLPFRLKMAAWKGGCEVFMPARYSKVIDAPSLLTGPMTIVGKVVRRLTKKEKEYFDVDTAVRYERALAQSSPEVRTTLGVNPDQIRDVVNSSATIDYPGLVVLPIAMYK